MILKEVKQTVFELTCTENTKQLKRQRPELTKGRDLRYKAQWVAVLNRIKDLRQSNQDCSLADLEESEVKLKNSLFKVGRMAGRSESDLAIDWQRIQLEAQFGDIHIEEL